MKDMKTLAEKTREELMNDLLICISHDYDKQNDLLCMTEQYYRYPDLRPELETEMLELLLGNPYKNPFLCYYGYDQSHMVDLDEILTDFELKMENTRTPQLTLENVIVQIGELHDKCSGELIDDYRAPKLETYLLAVSDFAEAADIVERKKRW